LTIKYDKDKPRWDLLPMEQLEDVVDVLTSGAKKYADDNWKTVKPMRPRYFAAFMRHVIAWWNGEIKDSETGKSHLAHAICCLLFLMWGDDQEKEVTDGS